MAKQKVAGTPDVFPAVITDAQARKIGDIASAWGLSKQFLVDSIREDIKQYPNDVHPAVAAEEERILLDVVHGFVRAFPKAWPNGVKLT